MTDSKTVTDQVLLRRLRRLNRAMAVLVFVVGPVAGFLTSVCISKWYWGYFFSRPSIQNVTEDYQSIDRVTPVSAIPLPAGGYEFSVAKRGFSPVPMQADEAQAELLESMQWARKAPYDSPTERALLALDQSGLLHLPGASITDGELASWYGRVDGTGLLMSGKPNYNHAKQVFGYWIEGQDANGRRLVLAALSGWDVSNDHRPHYEILFESVDDGATWRLKHAQTYMYDVAGLEGMEWYTLLIPITLLLELVLVPIAMCLTMLGLWKKRQHLSRKKKGKCAQCNYDLRGNPTAACPECGFIPADPSTPETSPGTQ